MEVVLAGLAGPIVGLLDHTLNAGLYQDQAKAQQATANAQIEVAHAQVAAAQANAQASQQMWMYGALSVGILVAGVVAWKVLGE